MKDTSTGWMAARRGPKQWKADEARRVLAAWKQSGESMSGFAFRHGINPQRVAWWRCQLAAKSPAPITLVPMMVRASTTSTPAVSISLGGVRVDVDPSRVSPQWFAAVVEMLTGRST